MASNFGNIALGIITVLEANITNLRGYDSPVDSINQFPSAVVLPDPLNPEVTFSGNTFESSFRVVFLVSSGDSIDGFRQLYDYIDPTQANKSFRAAIKADPTLDGSVDDSELTIIENIGRREVGGGFYFGFDAVVRFIKTVA